MVCGDCRGAAKMKVTQVAAASTRSRHSWMDFLRGFAILLVIAFHSTKMLSRVDLMPPMWLKDATEFFALYRMPTLMFLSGLLLPQSLKKDTVTYFTGKIRSVLWPYLVWSGVTALVFSRDVSSIQAIVSLLNAGSYLWFLFFIGLFYGFAYFVKRVNPLAIAVVAFVVAVAALFASKGIQVQSRMFYLMSYFFLGAFVARHWDAFLTFVDKRTSLVAVLIAILGGIAAAYFDLKSQPMAVPVVFAFIVGACYLSRKVADKPWAQLPNYVGQNSLKFYVSHFPAIYLFDVLGTQLGLEHSGVLAVLSIFVALAVGMIFSVASEKSVAVQWLFSAPKFQGSRFRRPPAAI